MKTIELKKISSIKPNGKVGDIEPNVTEDALFVEDGQIIGFYIHKVSGRCADLLRLCNKEFRSERVPKMKMDRSEVLSTQRKMGCTRSEAREQSVSQYSTIIGSIPPRAHMKRPYPTRSSVHLNSGAQVFIKGMIALAKESESIIESIDPIQYEKQKKLIEQHVPEKWRFANLFTSSISNFNISASIHRDNGNLVGCSNVIFSTKRNATGGNLHLPEYGATIESSDLSMIVYPAWRNYHGVTPIHTQTQDGYRNSLVFYPLKAFEGL